MKQRHWYSPESVERLPAAVSVANKGPMQNAKACNNSRNRKRFKRNWNEKRLSYILSCGEELRVQAPWGTDGLYTARMGSSLPPLQIKCALLENFEFSSSGRVVVSSHSRCNQGCRCNLTLGLLLLLLLLIPISMVASKSATRGKLYDVGGRQVEQCNRVRVDPMQGGIVRIVHMHIRPATLNVCEISKKRVDDHDLD